MLAELRELAEAMPVPQPAWHPHVRLIVRVRDELLAGIDRLEALPDGEERAERLLGVELEPQPGSALAELPVPEGEHPFLGEILAVLEAGRLVQTALAAASLTV
ncbi:MAG TPA: hypothetical protein VFL60_05725 [Gaiellaceae bacterium]|nr:hypothetical protein [Gaiellaceae bacterium]